LSRAAGGSLLDGWDEDAAKLLVDRVAAVGAAGFKAGLRRKGFLRKSSM
jgi:hypothetical protein